MSRRRLVESLQRPLLERVGWLLLIWSASVLGLAVVAWGLRLLMRAAGLSSP